MCVTEAASQLCLNLKIRQEPRKERNSGNSAVGERDVGILVTADTESTFPVPQQKLYFWRRIFGQMVKHTSPVIRDKN
jgi:hypothetical protein